MVFCLHEVKLTIPGKHLPAICRIILNTGIRPPKDRYDSKLLQDPRVETFQPEELISNLKHLVASSTGKILINIDFDFLFHGVGKRAYPDDLLVTLLENIKSSLGPQMILVHEF